jgi:hypothetical protein
MDSSHSLFSTNLVPSARLVLEADFDPQLPTRVLGRFAELGRLPTSFTAHNLDDETVRVEVEFAAEPDAARLLSRRLLNLPSVRTVELSFRRARIARAAA